MYIEFLLNRPFLTIVKVSNGCYLNGRSLTSVWSLFGSAMSLNILVYHNNRCWFWLYNKLRIYFILNTHMMNWQQQTSKRHHFFSLGYTCIFVHMKNLNSRGYSATLRRKSSASIVHAFDWTAAIPWEDLVWTRLQIVIRQLYFNLSPGRVSHI